MKYRGAGISPALELTETESRLAGDLRGIHKECVRGMLNCYFPLVCRSLLFDGGAFAARMLAPFAMAVAQVPALSWRNRGARWRG